MEIEELVDEMNENNQSLKALRNDHELSKHINGVNSNMSNEFRSVKSSEKKFDIEQFVRRNCTFFTFEGEPIMQAAYICIVCDPEKLEKICKECLVKCHKNCKKISKTESSIGNFEFNCSCGKNNKHLILSKNTIKKNSCSLIQFDKKILINSSFICQSCNIQVCSICYYDCHYVCKEKRKLEDVSDVKCECAHDNHSLMNEFTFNIVPQKYFTICDIEVIWPIHIVNSLFSTAHVYKDLSDFVLQNISMNEGTKGIGVKLTSIISSLSNFFGTTFKTFYFNENILKMFPYEEFSKFIFKEEKEEFFIEDLILKFRMLSILLIIHIKKDFQILKNFITSDFLTCSILERLLYRKFIFSENAYTKLINEKYNLNKKERGFFHIFGPHKTNMTPKDIIFKMLNILKINSHFFGFTLAFQNEFVYLLEFISFLLKKMLFQKFELIKLINDLYEIFAIFLTPIIQEEPNNIEIDLVKELIKIFYIISVNYNDLIIQKYFKLIIKNGGVNIMEAINNLKNDNKSFIHSNSTYGNMLFKMLIQVSKVFIHFDTAGKDNIKSMAVYDKAKFLYNECLNIFILADNNYSKQILNIKPQDLINYTKMVNNVDKLPPGIIIVQDYLVMSTKNDELISDFLGLKMKIEKILEIYFMYDNVSSVRFSHNTIQYIKSFAKNYQPTNKNKLESLTDNSTEANLYVIKILQTVKEYFPFVTNENFNIDECVGELIFSSLDETLTKFLLFFTHDYVQNSKTFVENKLLDNEIAIFLSFLKLFCLKRESLKYFFTGKNFSRLCDRSLFHKFPLKLIEFLYFVFKGLEIYKINISDHKMLKPLHDRLYENLCNLKKRHGTDTDIIEYKKHLIYTIKVLDISTKFCEIEYFDNIKRKFIKFIIEDGELKFLSSDKFFHCFSIDIELEKKKMLDEEMKESILSNANQVNILSNNDDNLVKSENNDDIENKLLIVRENKIQENKSFEQLNFHEDSLYKMLSKQFSKKHQNFNLMNENSQLIIKEDSKHITRKLYFSFFNFVSKNLYYVFSDDNDQNFIMDTLLSFNDIENFKVLLKTYCITIKQRLILIRYLRNLYFLEKVNKNDYTQRTTPLSKKEYKEFYMHRENLQKIENEEHLKNIEVKFKHMNIMQKIIGLFLSELENFEEFTKFYEVSPNNNNTMAKLEDDIRKISSIYIDMNLYSTELLLSIKSIFDYYYLEKNQYGVKIFYKLAYTFLTKSALITEIITLSQSFTTPFKIINMENSRTIKSTDNLIKNVLEYMKRLEFNIFNTKNIYAYVIQVMWEIFRKTGLYSEYTLGNFLKTFDIQSESNFFPDLLIETKDYEYFYETSEILDVQNNEQDVFLDIKNIFDTQFIQVQNTNFMNVITITPGEADLVDYRRNIIEYFIVNFTCPITNFKSNNSLSLLTIVTKMLFYDNEETQKRLTLLINSQLNNKNNFFESFNVFLKESLVINFSLCRNFFANHCYQKITNLTKLLIQFFQLIAEGFNSTFYPKIFNIDFDGLNIEENLSNPLALQNSTHSIYNNILMNLITAFNLLQVENSIEVELPYDKLIVLITNMIDFLIEYMEGNEKYCGVITGYFKIIFEKLSYVLFTKISKIENVAYKSNSKVLWQKKKLLCYIKIRFLQLTISLIKKGDADEDLINQIIKVYNLPQLFQEILDNFYCIISSMINTNKVDKDIFTYDFNGFLGKIMDLYINDEEFRESLILNLCFKIYHLIKILSDIYAIINVKKYFEGNDKFHKKGNIEKRIPLFSETSLNIYKFLEMMILKVEIKRIEGETLAPKSYYNFFIRPSLTFHLSREALIEFFQNVNRESTFSKINHLMKETDYFIFEMIFNSRFKHNLFYKVIKSLYFYYFEIFNYILIILINCLVLYDFYRGPDTDKNNYYLKDSDFQKKYPDLIILTLIQISYLGIVILIWLKYKFPISYQHELMDRYNKFLFIERSANTYSKMKKMDYKELLKQNVRDFMSKKIGIFKLLSEINSEFTISQKVWVGTNVILLNRDINIMIATLIFYIIYIITNLPIFLVVPLLFIYNLSSILNTIYICVRIKWKQLVLILIFTYLVSYLFSWISLLWLRSVYLLEEMDINGEYSSENHCSSSIQCLMVLIEYGIVTAGTGFTIPRVSYKSHTGLYYGKFFFQLTYNIFVILILGNIFLAVIVDTFGELRDKNTDAEHDKNNVCFICQLNRDNSLNKNIDFETHVQIDHLTCNYIYFITYLHISNPNDFDTIQNYVWEKVNCNDISWLPFIEN